MTSPAPLPPPIRRIVLATSDVWGVSVLDLLSDRRAGRIVAARQAAMTLARDLTLASYPAIARAFRRSDHTTVMHACRRTAQRAAGDPEVAARMEAVRAMVAPAPTEEPAS
ncbi:helix-turn-helix domain-containing protein [uncultured Rhodospira sp.]|uniref:helix-turn-helix domain-containing protein n=1 Tax=uncultured Rhodospira sp. TaxID=1936189 RepID=UPI0026362F2D|nr:helix-turn-helix domain-containing protein [uncultured Rhodospira sp.]